MVPSHNDRHIRVAASRPKALAMVGVARASRPCVSRASCPRFEGKMPSTRKNKAKMASPHKTIAKLRLTMPPVAGNTRGWFQ
ncbi:MAG: hypothetical protein A2Y77_02350 [Planctomycetes bacterium RBG_13_62_9]|nr:MAG: hypothetical protein A2Y77_02350 [Planctomycetes bacterium RBG_13_62_9]